MQMPQGLEYQFTHKLTIKIDITCPVLLVLFHLFQTFSGKLQRKRTPKDFIQYSAIHSYVIDITNLNAMISRVCHNDVPFIINRDTIWSGELSIFCSLAAKELTQEFYNGI